MTKNPLPPTISGQCYCGAITIHASGRPEAIAYCHCADCRRVTGAPVAAFAEFAASAVTFTPDDGRHVSVNAGVTRSFCATCGSPIAGRYDYLPGKVYIGVGILDQADELAPRLHAHEAERLPWLHIDDDLERLEDSARSRLAPPSR